MPEVEAPAGQESHAVEVGHLQRKLQHAAREHGPGEHQHGGSKRSAKNAAPTMNATFSNAGVIAGTEKRFQVLNTPAEKATAR